MFRSGRLPGRALGLATYAGRMNPRYRRLVIPCALAGLILVVVIAAILKK